MVSSGRSKRWRVGFERSGSAVHFVSTHFDQVLRAGERNVLISRPSWSVCWMERREKVDTEPMLATVWISTLFLVQGSVGGDVLGWCSLRAVLGSALLERDFL